MDDLAFRLRDAPFGRSLTPLFIREKRAGKQLAISRTQKLYALSGDTRCPDLFDLFVLDGNDQAEFADVVAPGELSLRTASGAIYVCFDTGDIIYLRGKGAGARFVAHLSPECTAIALTDNTYQLSFDPIGAFLFVPISGALSMRSDGERAIIQTASDEFALAIHYHFAQPRKLSAYKPFEICAREARDDYLKWLSMYPPVPKRFEEMKRLAAYSVWICYCAPSGILKDNLIYFSKDYSALSWHSSYHALAITEDVDMAVKILCSIFPYMDERGQLPDLIDDQYANYLSTKPPIQGYVALKMLERWGDKLTREHCAKLYAPMKKWRDWWTTMRDSDHNGIPQYNQGCESGMDFTQMLELGTPVECPDLITYMALMEECLGALAARLDMKNEAAAWNARSIALVECLIDEFWDGERFFARLSTNRQKVVIREAEGFVPMMLGRRLPSEIVDKLAEKLADRDEYYTDIGFRSASKRENGGKPGVVMDFTQIRLIPGLFEAGKRRLALGALEGFLDKNLLDGPCFGYMEPDESGQAAENVFEQVDFMNKFSALSSSVFLVLANLLHRETGNEQGKGE